MQVKTILELTESDLKSIISKHMQLEKDQTVEFKIGRRSVGFGVDDHDEYFFKGCTITCMKDV